MRKRTMKFLLRSTDTEFQSSPSVTPDFQSIAFLPMQPLIFIDLLRRCSESPPSILPLQYPRPYECTMDNWDVTGFFVGDMIRQGRDVSVMGEKKEEKSRGRVTSLSDHAGIIMTVSRLLLTYNPASETIYFV